MAYTLNVILLTDNSTAYYLIGSNRIPVIELRIIRQQRIGTTFSVCGGLSRCSPSEIVGPTLIDVTGSRKANWVTGKSTIFKTTINK